MELMAATRKHYLGGSGERGSRVIPTVFPHLSQDRSIPMLGESNVLPGNDFPGRRCNYTVHPAQ